MSVERNDNSPSRSSISSSDESLDLEKQSFINPQTQKQQESPQQTPAEYGIPLRTKLTALGVWFLLNAVLTINNKATLNLFPFPWMLTALHASFASIGSLVMLCTGQIRLTALSAKDSILLALYSILFTMNIAMSNVSLALVSVPFHQTVRSTSPVVAILASGVLFGRRYSTETYLSLVPIVAGVALAAIGDYSYTAIGLCTTALGVGLAVAKTIVSNQLMTGSRRLGASEMLLRMSPFAAAQALGYAVASGEFAQFSGWAASTDLEWTVKGMLLANGLIAFMLNVSSLHTNRVAGVVSLSVAGNLKQCLTIALGIVLFNVHISWMNATGMAMVLAGAAWYSKAELNQRR